MVIMLVIARNYYYMMSCYPGSGGAYSYARELFGYDYAFLVAWFLILSYMAVYWANATSLPLYARYFIGDIFMFGPKYSVLGYELYLGEALVTALFIALICGICLISNKVTERIVTLLVFIFVIGIALVFIVSLAGHASASYSFDPAFLPGSNALIQITGIACISPWAFIGFENISNSTHEFSFKHNKIFKILVLSVLACTLVYILIIALEVTAYPPEYSGWLEYIKDSGNLSGITADALKEVSEHYTDITGIDESGYVSLIIEEFDRANVKNMFIVIGLFAVALMMLINNYSLMRKRASESEEELLNMRSTAYRDPLTGVKSKTAFTEFERDINGKLRSGDLDEFSVVVCDVNGLKHINDTYGHKAGDAYICEACKLICMVFDHSPVFRIGGDEFVVVMTGDDYLNRKALMETINRTVEENIALEKAVISCGISDFKKGDDTEIDSVFKRADALMYERKKELKAIGAKTRD